MYNKLLIEFNKNIEILNEFDIKVIIDEKYITSNYVTPTQLCATALTHSDSKKCVVVELDDYINNAVGGIRVIYNKGITGITGVPVPPFDITFIPSPMPELPLLRCAYGVKVSAATTSNTSSYIDSVDTPVESEKTLISISTIANITCSISFVGQINP